MSKPKVPIIRLTLHRFRGAVVMLAKSEQGPKAMWFASGLLLLMLFINGLNVVNSYVGRDFMSSIEHQDSNGFFKYAGFYIVVFIASTIVTVFYRYSEESLGLIWREQLTRRLTDAYLHQRTYYQLDSATGIANPDQRIADDVRAFTTTTLSFSLLIINGTLTALSFSGVLWSISPLLFGVAVLYALGGSALTIWLGSRLIQLNYHQLDVEANFRSDLIHVRENSESIALAHREGRFKVRLGRRLDVLTRNYRRIIGINRNLGFFTTLYNYFIQIIPALLVAPLFIRGDVEFGVITQSAMAFATLLGAFSLIVTQFQSISAFTAVTARLYGLSEAIEKAHELRPCALASGETMDTVSYQGVTLRSADNSRILVDRLDLTISPGSRWVVTGPDDAPKVALFRATAGLWDCGLGAIGRPGFDEILFLPERPYLPPGCLREILLRTGAENTTPDENILEVLRRLKVDDVVERAGGLGSDQDWDDLLSIGEQHMLSIARILLARPLFVFLDRPGSSIPKHFIATALELFSECNIGCVILAKNGESQLRYDACLDIRTDGKWTVRRNVPAANDQALADLSC